MRIRLSIAAALVAGNATSAFAADYLTEVTSEVFQAEGTASAIASRGRICISQNLASGVAGGELIISADPNSGIVVANSALGYGSLPRWRIRSRFTFEARDGRFRIQQTNLERFNEMGGGWGPIGKWTGSQWKGAETAFVLSAAKVAACVKAAAKADEW